MDVGLRPPLGTRMDSSCSRRYRLKCHSSGRRGTASGRRTRGSVPSPSECAGYGRVGGAERRDMYAQQQLFPPSQPGVPMIGPSSYSVMERDTGLSPFTGYGRGAGVAPGDIYAQQLIPPPGVPFNAPSRYSTPETDTGRSPFTGYESAGGAAPGDMYTQHLVPPPPPAVPFIGPSRYGTPETDTSFSPSTGYGRVGGAERGDMRGQQLFPPAGVPFIVPSRYGIRETDTGLSPVTGYGPRAGAAPGDMYAQQLYPPPGLPYIAPSSYSTRQRDTATSPFTGYGPGAAAASGDMYAQQLFPPPQRDPTFSAPSRYMRETDTGFSSFDGECQLFEKYRVYAFCLKNDTRVLTNEEYRNKWRDRTYRFFEMRVQDQPVFAVAHEERLTFPAALKRAEESDGLRILLAVEAADGEVMHSGEKRRLIDALMLDYQAELSEDRVTAAVKQVEELSDANSRLGGVMLAIERRTVEEYLQYGATRVVEEYVKFCCKFFRASRVGTSARDRYMIYTLPDETRGAPTTVAYPPPPNQPAGENGHWMVRPAPATLPRELKACGPCLMGEQEKGTSFGTVAVFLIELQPADTPSGLLVTGADPDASATFHAEWNLFRLSWSTMRAEGAISEETHELLLHSRMLVGCYRLAWDAHATRITEAVSLHGPRFGAAFRCRLHAYPTVAKIPATVLVDGDFDARGVANAAGGMMAKYHEACQVFRDCPIDVLVPAKNASRRGADDQKVLNDGHMLFTINIHKREGDRVVAFRTWDDARALVFHPGQQSQAPELPVVPERAHGDFALDAYLHKTRERGLATPFRAWGPAPGPHQHPAGAECDGPRFGDPGGRDDGVLYGAGPASTQPLGGARRRDSCQAPCRRDRLGRHNAGGSAAAVAKGTGVRHPPLRAPAHELSLLARVLIHGSAAVLRRNPPVDAHFVGQRGPGGTTGCDSGLRAPQSRPQQSGAHGDRPGESGAGPWEMLEQYLLGSAPCRRGEAGGAGGRGRGTGGGVP